MSERGTTPVDLESLPREELPERLEPMLARPGPLPADEEGWAYEVKWDGVRVLGHADRGDWRALSRRGEDVTARYPELAAIAAAIADRAVVLDGEIVARDAAGRPSFQLLQRRMGLTARRSIERRARETPVDYVIFDLLHLDGRSTRELPYERRRELLDGLRLDGPAWSAPRDHRGDGAALLEAARERGLEGIVAKRLEAPYRPGRRTGEWIKVRLWRRQEVVIGGYVPGEGTRSRRVGGLLVGCWDATPAEAAARGERQRLVFAGGVGSGLSGEMVDRLTAALEERRRADSPFDVGAPGGPKARTAVFCEPELVCEVAYTEWTEAGTMRQPAFKGMREDVDPREVVREPG